MGSLNLLVLVIAICLIVLGVLTFISARSSAQLTDRQANATHEEYVEEYAGQVLVKGIDSHLKVARDRADSPETTMWVMTSILDQLTANAIESASSYDGEVTCDSSVVPREEIATLMGIDPAIAVEDATSMGIAAPEEAIVDEATIAEGTSSQEEGRSDASQIRRLVTIEESGSDSDDSASAKDAYMDSLLEEIDECAGAINAVFSTRDGKNLHCVIAINRDGTYKILKWQSSRTWNNSRSETLWLG